MKNKVSTRVAGTITAVLVLFGGFAHSASAALIDAGSEIAFFGSAGLSGGSDLSSATGLTFGAPSIIGAGTNSFAPYAGGFAFFSNFDLALAGPTTILTFDGGGSTSGVLGGVFTATSLTIDFQSPTALDITMQGVWGLNGFDDTAGTLVLTADSDGGLTTFSATGAVSPVPVPGALLLFGSAIFGLGAMRRRVS